MDEEIIVLGFYNRGNLGDESYMYTMKTLFGNNMRFICIDSLSDEHTTLLQNTKIVICGGGDILSSYFMKKVEKFLTGYDGRLYAVSVGIPYKSEIYVTNFINIFDHVFVRTKSDYDFLKNIIGKENVDMIPDLAWNLNMNESNTISSNNTKHIAFCLAQPCFTKNKNKQKLIKSLSNVCQKLISEHGFHVTFIPFNTHEKNKNECDIQVNNIIIDLLNKTNCDSNLYDTIIEKDSIKMLDVFKNYNLVVGMRFHSIIFSAKTNTPFVAIQVSNKLKNTLTDFQCDETCVYSLTCDESNLPIEIDEDILYNLILNNIDKPKNIYVDKLMFQQCINIVKKYKKKSSLRMKPHVVEISEIEDKVQTNVMTYLGISQQHMKKIYYGDCTFPQNTSHQDLAKIILFTITNSLNSPCFWGLCENMKTDNFILKDAVEYIHKYHMMNQSKNKIQQQNINVENKMFANIIHLTSDDYSKKHRSGWQFVLNNLREIDAKTNNKKGEFIFLDDYVDRTFQWGKVPLKHNNIIPYKKPWIGIIHHTFHEANGENGCGNLIYTEEFKESIKYCKRIITLSEYLKKQIIDEFNKNNILVQVNNLTHPTDVSDIKMFTLQNFYENKEKKIIHIGGWLRNSFVFYNTNTPFKKAILQYDNITPPKDITNVLNDKYNNNSFIQGFIQFIKECESNIEIIEKLTNNEYDTLLSKNIVFLNVFDASAVNTIIECIVRNTIIIVNRHPAIEEVLGKEYPGLYNSIHEVNYMCSNEILEKCYKYLYKMNKDKFKIETFMNDLNNILMNTDIS